MRITERLTADHAALIVVDVQTKLISRIKHGNLVIANAVRLVRAAEQLGIPVWGTEQYPEGLGPTVPELTALLPHRSAKTTFHCCSVPELLEQLYGRRIRHITLTGIEAHVCIAQTALELLNLGFRVQVPADAVASRSEIDSHYALRRLELAGAVVSTTEAVLFEWTECSDRPQFKAISDLIKSFAAPAPVPSER
jgi:nicotinamidase-related amidase